MKNYDQFHDGSLDGFLIDQASVQVFLGSEQKQPFVIAAGGVVAMAADGFKAGNIIFEVLMRPSEELTLQDVAETYGLAAGVAGEDQARKLLEKAKEQGLILLEINPSYGGHCLILAKSFELLHRHEWAERRLVSAVR
jgi:hypothetical protein